MNDNSLSFSDLLNLQRSIHHNIVEKLSSFFTNCLQKNCLFSIIHEANKVIITINGVETPVLTEEIVKFMKEKLIKLMLFRKSEIKKEI